MEQSVGGSSTRLKIAGETKKDGLNLFKLFDKLSDGILVADKEFRILYQNSSFKQLFKQRFKIQRENESVIDISKELLDTASFAQLCEALLKHETIEIEDIYSTQEFKINLNVEPDELNGFVFSFIKEKIETESKQIVESNIPPIPIVPFVFELLPKRRLKFKHIGDNFERVVRPLRRQLLDERLSYFLSRIHPLDLPKFLSTMENSRKQGLTWFAEFRFLTTGETTKWFKIVADNSYDSGDTNLWHGYLEDITSRKLNDLEKGKLVNETLDFERARFSMELHDGLAQYLVALNLYLGQIEESKVVDPTIYGHCKRLISDSLNQTRTLCYNLSPPELNNGWLEAIEVLFDKMNSLSTIRFSLTATKSIQRNIDSEQSYNIFRIIQEFISNSMKHGECTEINCHIRTRLGKIYVLVSDNGSGFDKSSIKHGFGLNNMEKRAKISGVDIEISSEINKGTFLKLAI
jgi:signal transduction histidine kinase